MIISYDFEPNYIDVKLGTSATVKVNYDTSYALGTFYWMVISENGIPVYITDESPKYVVFEIDTTYFDFIGTDEITLELYNELELVGTLVYQYNIIEEEEDIPYGDIYCTGTFNPVSLTVDEPKTYTLNLTTDYVGTNDWIYVSSNSDITLTKYGSNTTGIAIGIDCSNIDFNSFVEQDFRIRFKQKIPNSYNYYYIYDYVVNMVGTYSEPTPQPPTINFSIVANPTIIYYQYNSTATYTVNLTITGTSTEPEWSYEENPYINIKKQYSGLSGLNVVYELKLKTVNKEDVIRTKLVFSATISGVTKNVYVDVEISGFGLSPIWKDKFYTFENIAGSVEYIIMDEKTNDIVYSGKAKRYPDSDKITININNITRDYLTSHFNSFGKSIINVINDYSKPFSIIVDGKKLNTIYFYNDWSYNNNTDDLVLNDPIYDVLDSRQYFIFSLFDRLGNETEVKYTLNVDEFHTQNRYMTVSNKQQTLICDKLSNYPNAVRLGIAGNNKVLAQYEIKKTCYDYCLYYVNAYGGWDSMLIKGNVIKSDNITSSYYSKFFDNTTIDFEKVKYHNNITTNYTLYTDWFNDKQQSKMYHLLESTEVYLHNLKTDELFPCNITNKKCEWKTFKNNGNKKFYNQIDVEVAQTKIRL